MLQASEDEFSEFDSSDLERCLWLTELQTAACPSEPQRWLGRDHMTFAEDFRAKCPAFDKSDKTDFVSLTMNQERCQASPRRVGG
jgi:hypothetical protein